ncbi:VWA domain-containing protein [Cutibacterium acnes]|uniref:VWA domain-containing protein n=1 Tax=Cutibacterium acnes TaxID=1747 RepID=UPI000EA05BC4|nr:VWA domain-containing protein [Cutibacterium acnes]MBU5409677.1 VWA domain-containing protein [Cutibacterium acnes]RKI34819.1 VWA domain-containing protein [Cutibacterium acnes]
MAMMTLIAFGRPGRLWWLVVPVVFVAVYLVVVMWRRQPHQGRNELKRLLPSSRPWKQHLAMGLSVLSMAIIVLAFAQPKAYHEVPRDRATVVVAIDVSRSMVATDVEPSRLSAAKTAAKDFLGDLPPRFNVSLVKFAASAQVVVPPTTDRAAVSTAITNLQVLPSTAIGEGIYSSLNALKLVPDDPKHPGQKPPAAIVLLSDGATNVGRPSLEAAKEAGRQHVPVYTIAYGTAGGYVVEGGQRQPVPVNHYELAAIAKASGGEKFSAESLGQLSDVYKSIAQSVGYEKVFGEVTDKYVGVALALVVLTAASVISLCARWP